MLARQDFHVLPLLCDYFHTEDDMDGDEVGLTLLRSLVARYDSLGYFEAEYFEKQHHTTESGHVFVPSNALPNPAYRTSFVDLVSALNLEELTYTNMKTAYEALMGMDVSVRAAIPRPLPTIVGIYCLLFTLVRKMLDYYASLIASLFRDPAVVAIRAGYRSLHSQFQHLPYLQIVKAALLGHDLSKYELKLGP